MTRPSAAQETGAAIHVEYSFQPLDFSRSRTFPLAERRNKVSVDDFARISPGGGAMARFFAGLPDILAGRDFKELVRRMRSAATEKKVTLFTLGAHVIKCGLTPWLIELMERGLISAIALNGAGAIHDSELALIGETSEDVAAGIHDGTFGMWKETGELMGRACSLARREGTGLGESLGRLLVEEDAPFRRYSLLARGWERRIPVTVHVAFGGDIFHIHPGIDGASLGEATFRDFRLVCGVVSRVDAGSVIVNFGSAVVLPTVIEKAITVARNQGFPVEGFVGANFDFVRNYRANLNPVQRARDLGGVGLSFTGHHELMMPLLFSALLEEPPA